MPRIPEVYQCAFCPHVNAAGRTWAKSLQFLSRRIPAARAGFFAFLASLLFILFMHSSFVIVRAQSATATLSGTVTDQNNAVIPGVNIEIISIAQGFRRSARTSAEGAFVVPQLPPGHYTVKAEREGFTPVEVRDIVLSVNDQVTIKIALKVGALQGQTVDVVDGVTLIDQSAVVSTLIDGQLVQNLPLNGRSFQSLITLSPGTVLTATRGEEGGQFSVNGQRANANYVTVDGVSANIGTTFLVSSAYSQSSAGSLPGLAATGGTTNLVSIDALQEFKILTSSYAPEFGRTPGGQVSIVTRSGTNDFHGSLFEYFRNDALDANNWFSNSRGVKKAALRQNIFGGVIGGPIMLPQFGEGGRQPWYNGRNETFFFFSYEGHRLRLPKFAITDVPSLSARRDPAAPPAIQQLLSAYPLPTGPERANRSAEFAAGYSDPSSLDATSIRIDHTMNSKLTLFGRYNYSPSDSVARTGFGSSPVNELGSLTNKTKTLTIGTTSILKVNLINEFRINWSKVEGSSVLTLDSFGGAVVPPRSFFIPSAFDTPHANTIISLNVGNFSQLRLGSPADNLQRQINLLDSVSLTQGSHQLKFGMDYRRLSPVLGASSYSPQIFFGGVAGALTGRTLGAIIVSIKPSLQPIYNNFSAYGQDTWQATPRLTLTYGLRWEINPAPHEKNGNDPAVVTGLDNPSTITLAPFGTPLYKTVYSNFAPRVGAAYQVSKRSGLETVLRGGFGIFYDLGNETAASAFTVFPFATQKRLLGAAAPFFPLTPAEAAPASFRAVPSAAFDSVVAFDPNLKLPRTYQWNFAVEQSLGSNQTVSASYVAAVGRRLLRQDNLAGAALNNPSFTNVTVTRNSASSDYHAMQIQLDRRLTRGFQALASYTWSHSIDIASRDSATLETFPTAGVDPRIDRGSSDFDIRHAFRIGTTYNLPRPGAAGFDKTLLRGWSVDAIYTAQSAPPVDILYFSSTSQFSLIFARPDLIQGVPLYLYDRSFPGGRRINRAAFSIPNQANPRQGSLGRNSLRGFSLSQLDFAVRRQFRLSERANIQFKAEFFNLLNHPNFGNPSFTLSSGSFGLATQMLNVSLGTGGSAGGLNPLYQVGGPRSIQLSLRLQY
jgi:hypothetical protein